MLHWVDVACLYGISQRLELLCYCAGSFLSYVMLNSFPLFTYSLSLLGNNVSEIKLHWNLKWIIYGFYILETRSYRG
jgi:hypothetical protein